MKRLKIWVTGWLRNRSRFETRARRRRDTVLRGSIGDDSLLEERCLLSGILMPSNTVPSTVGVRGVLHDGGLVTPTPFSEAGGSYAYTFACATLSLIADAGFEQPANVAQLAGGYPHGTQLKPSGDQPWTFTDGDPSQQIYAGIAGVGSMYTKNHDAAPQGLQVGFIQGNSSISQPVTFAAGSYQISFFAVQAASNTADQPPDVRIDGQLVGTVAITPTGNDYARYTTAVFTVTSGQHAIMFQKAGGGTNTVLIGAVTFKPASDLGARPPVPHRPPVEIEVLPVARTPGRSLFLASDSPVIISVAHGHDDAAGWKAARWHRPSEKLILRLARARGVKV